MKSMLQKENVGSGVSASQAFPSGFAKFIGDGGASDKVDPTQLPMAVKDGNTPKFGLNLTSFHTKNQSSGSFKSGSTQGGREGITGAYSTDETNSNN